jgi:hypothetical protein
MHTPGRCANTESCWIGNSGRTVRVLLGADFVCPACKGRLHAPSVASMARLRRGNLAAFALGAMIVAGAAFVVTERLPGAPALTKIVAAASSHVQALSDIMGGGGEDAAPEGKTLAARQGGGRAGWHVLGSLDSMLLPGAQPLPNRAATRRADAPREHWAYGKQGWVADGAADPARTQPEQAGQDAAPQTQDAVGAERTPLTVPSELAMVQPPKPSPGATVVGNQEAEPIRPPALFGGSGEADSEDEPPMAQLADLEPESHAQIVAAETESNQAAKRGRRRPPSHRAALRDALREALSTDTEHVTLPATAAPALPRYPALFAQEYPAGRVSAVCLVAAAGSRPDCKVLGTGSSLSMTQSVGDWPKAGQVHYRPIAANARRAQAVWKPLPAHS